MTIPEGNQYTFVDLFAGIGGFHIAFKRAHCHCCFASEIDKHARATYKANFSLEPFGDIKLINERTIPDHDILAAGFPCQPFSLAGVSKYNALGLDHGFRHLTKGTLFFDIARILEAKRPRAFLLENVKNLIGHDKGRTFDLILKTLTLDLKYSVSFGIVDARVFVPQHRERVYIVGFREQVGFRFPEFSGPTKTLPEILEKRVEKKYTLTPKLWQYLQDYRAKHFRQGHGFGFSMVEPDDPKSITRTLSARYHKDGSEILIGQGNHRLPRRLTPLECARLMGFPEKFKIESSDTQAYRQFGNAVVVPVAEAFAREIVSALSRFDKHRSEAQFQSLEQANQSKSRAPEKIIYKS